MVEGEGSARTRIDNKYARVEAINPQAWKEVREQFSVIIEKFSIPLAFVVKKKYDKETLEERKKVTLIDLVDRMVGRTPPRVIFADARQFGLTPSGLLIITEATAKLIAEETNTDLVFAKGQGVDNEASRIQKVVNHAQRARSYMTATPNNIERRVIELCLTGEQTDTVAKVISQELGIEPQLNKDNVNKIFAKAVQSVDHLQPGRLRERGFRAKQALQKIENNQWINRKAQLTERVLSLLNSGYARDAILDELDIDKNLYKGLVKEVFIELRGDNLGWQEFIAVLEGEGIKRSQLNMMGPATVNKVSRYLIGPYRGYRMRIGEEVMPSGEVTTKRASAREKQILEAMAHGAQDQLLASKFQIDKGYIGLIADTLADYADVRKSHEAQLRERIDFYNRFKNDLANAGKNLGGLPQSIGGVPMLSVLELLAQDKTFHEVINLLTERTGESMTYAQLFHAYSKLRATYSTRS